MTACVAVTGATGFIGRRLLDRLLAQGFSLRVLARRRRRVAQRPGLCVIPGSLEDEASLIRLVEGASVVIHCAGLIKAVNTEALQRVNVEGTARLVRACAGAADSKRLIMLSSLAARHPQLSAYAASKRAGEEALASSAGALDWVVLRPPAVYGPGDRETWLFFRYLKLRILPLPGVDSARLALIYVDDLCDAICAVAKAQAVTKTVLEVHDGRREGYSWGEIARACEISFGKSILHLALPRSVLEALALGQAACHRLWGRPPDLTADKINELYWKDWTCRENPLTAKVKWKPKYCLEEGLKETLNWYKDNDWL